MLPTVISWPVVTVGQFCPLFRRPEIVGARATSNLNNLVEESSFWPRSFNLSMVIDHCISDVSI
jgi:hypothetical protein